MWWEKTYADIFIGKRASLQAEKVAQSMGLKTVKEIQNEKLNGLKQIRAELKKIHDNVLRYEKPTSFEQYITQMKAKHVNVIPSINKGHKLQGFRFEYKGVNLLGKTIEMSANLAASIAKSAIKKAITKGIDIGL